MSSFFGRGSTPSPSSSSGAINSAKVEMAEMQMDSVSDMFHRLVNSCFDKCVSTRFTDSDLSKGESVCIDRCFVKYMDSSVKIQDVMQAVNQQKTGGGGGGSGSGFAFWVYKKWIRGILGLRWWPLLTGVQSFPTSSMYIILLWSVLQMTFAFDKSHVCMPCPSPSSLANSKMFPQNWCGFEVWTTHPRTPHYLSLRTSKMKRGNLRDNKRIAGCWST